MRSISTPSKDYVELICRLYDDVYDDQEEDSAPGGLDWKPGQKAKHKSLGAFQRELEKEGIKLTTGKIKKILITGGRWSTERTREVGYFYEHYTDSKESGGEGLSRTAAINRISLELEISSSMVCMSLPYDRVVYSVPGKSSNAVRCDRSRKKRASCKGRPSDGLIIIKCPMSRDDGK